MQHQYWYFLKNSSHCVVCLVPWHISHCVIKIYEACASLRIWTMRCNLRFNNFDLWSRSLSVEQTKNIPEIEPPVWIWFSRWVGQTPTPARGSLSISAYVSRGMLKFRIGQNPRSKTSRSRPATSRFPPKTEPHWQAILYKVRHQSWGWFHSLNYIEADRFQSWSSSKCPSLRDEMTWRHRLHNLPARRSRAGPKFTTVWLTCLVCECRVYLRLPEHSHDDGGVQQRVHWRGSE